MAGSCTGVPKESGAESGMFAGLFQVACATKEKPQGQCRAKALSFPPGHHQRVRDVIAAGHAYRHGHFLSNSQEDAEGLAWTGHAASSAYGGQPLPG